MFSRLSFEIRRHEHLTDEVFTRILKDTAEHHGLVGRISLAGHRRFAAVLEGNSDSILMFEAVLDYIEIALGTVTGIHATHHHETQAFPAFSGVVVEGC